eukprot:9480304-Pyramimonas_sp.AAC.1
MPTGCGGAALGVDGPAASSLGLFASSRFSSMSTSSYGAAAAAAAGCGGVCCGPPSAVAVPLHLVVLLRLLPRSAPVASSPCAPPRCH